MGVSRRAFLRAAACVPLAAAARIGADASGLAVGNDHRTLLLDSPCLLPESFEGYKECATAIGGLMVAPADCSAGAALVLAPAAALTNVAAAQRLRRRAESGALVLVESGGMFLSPAEFRRQQSVVQRVFGLTVLPPVELWRQPARAVPYINFTWPVPARVRDFSRLVPLAAGRAAGNRTTDIAHVEDAVAAVKTRAGQGSLVLLGSPLGPHLLSGDREARSWFLALAKAEYKG